MTFPSRTPERRRQEYERNLATTIRWQQALKEKPAYARRILAAEMGVKASELPDDLVEARLEIIKLRRAIHSAECERIYPKIVKRYQAGEIAKDLAKEFRLDLQRVLNVLRDAGVEIKRRPFCIHGHAMDAENTRFSKEGWRYCAECSRQTARRSAQRKRAAANQEGKA